MAPIPQNDAVKDAPALHPGTDATDPIKGSAANAYKPGDADYSKIFTHKATSDKGKTDEQLNQELNFAPLPVPLPAPHPSIAVPNHATGITDVHRGLDNVNSAATSLNDAINSAKHGDTTGAMQSLRDSANNLYTGGENFDKGEANTADLVKGDKDAQKSQSHALSEEKDAGNYLQDAAQRLRDGDVKGALSSMAHGSQHMTEEQKALHHNLSQVTQDDKTFNHSQGLTDVRTAINGGDTVTNDLNQASMSARSGNTLGAIEQLRQGSIDLNQSSSHLDSGTANLRDLIGTDAGARNDMNRGTDSENGAYAQINNAEQLLREGKTSEADVAIQQAIGNVRGEQSALGSGLHTLQNDYAPGLGDSPTPPPPPPRLITEPITFLPLNNADNSDTGAVQGGNKPRFVTEPLTTPPNYARTGDNGMVQGENPPTAAGSTAWDPYEALTLPLNSTQSNVINGADRSDNGMVQGENPPTAAGSTAWDPYESLTLPLNSTQSNVINGADRSDNGMVQGENPPTAAGSTAWDPYESLTLPLNSTQSNVINGADRSDNGMVQGENPPTAAGSTAWDPYEALTLPLNSTKSNAVNSADRSDNGMVQGENPPSSTGNTAWDPYEAYTAPQSKE